MKKPKEIKKSLRIHSFPHPTGCNGCAYREKKLHCTNELHKDVIEYIKRLESKPKQAVEDILLLGHMGANICPVCAHYNHGAGDPKHCPKALKEDCFEWRGTKEG